MDSLSPQELFNLYKSTWEENKNPNALIKLAFCYGNGYGCERNYQEAFRLYKLNWEENKISDSLHNLALCYQHGHSKGKYIIYSIYLTS